MIDTAELNQRINIELLADKDTNLKRKNPNEQSGPCPFCGGRDRFSVQADKWLCRHCTEGKWADPIDYAMRRNNWTFIEVAKHYLGNDAPKFDPAVAAQREARRKAEQDQRQKEVQTRLSEFTTAELWHELNRRMADEQRQQWRMWGIPDSWQDNLELGYTPQYSKSIPTPAYTIPYFHNSTSGKKFQTMQYRLTDAPNPDDRYRFEYGLPAAWYEVTPSQDPGEIAIVCEGAKKAMVLQIYTAPSTNASVYAIPAKSTFCGIAEFLKDRSRVYIVLDPDAEHEALKLAAQVGKNARIVKLHVKLDDGILLHGIDKSVLRSAFRWADRVKV